MISLNRQQNRNKRKKNVGEYKEMETNLNQMETKYWQKMDEKTKQLTQF